MQKLASKCLVLRLSSLGDVILASASLQVRPGADWVVAQPFAEPLEAHPRIGKLWVFDPHSGLRGWKALCRQLWGQNYDEVIDLHGSLRTWLARGWFLLWHVLDGKRGHSKRARWTRAPKQRVRLWSYFILKGLLPKALRPESKVVLAGRAAGGSGTERPDLSHLVTQSLRRGETLPDWPKPYICVMPASRWHGKEWPVERYVELVEKLGRFAVVLGTDRDPASVRLAGRLQACALPHFSAVGKLSLSAVARALTRAEAYVGSDTGIAHLAEAVGTRAWVVFGPTAPDGGFGPWREESRALGTSLWCRPCGKDGRYCFRTRRQLCLSSLSVREAIRQIGAENTPTRVGPRA